MPTRILNKAAVGAGQLIVALSLCALAVYLEIAGVNPETVGLTGLTLVLVGFLCYRTRAFWKKPLYWAVLVGFVGLQAAVATLFWAKTASVSILAYSVILCVELIGLFWAIRKLFRGTPADH